eukprot:4692286-Amphidinium_carterae.1
MLCEVLIDDTGEDDDEAAKIKQLRLSCCLNIAASKSKLGSYSESIAASNVALELDPTNLKALYRRAEARVKPAGSTAYDFECAIKEQATTCVIATNVTLCARDTVAAFVSLLLSGLVPGKQH